MKRSPIHRHAELQRHAFMRAVNPERKAKRKAEGEVYGLYDEDHTPRNVHARKERGSLHYHHEAP